MLNPSSIDTAMESLSKLGQIEFVPAGGILFREGGAHRGVFLVLDGTVETFMVDDELQTYTVLHQYCAGQLVGFNMASVVGSQVSIRARTDCKVCLLSSDIQQTLASGTHTESPSYILLLQHSLVSINHNPARSFNEQQQSSPVVDAIVKRSVIAQNSLLSWPEDRIDLLIADIADAVNRQAWELADAAIAETGMGVVAHRVQKILLGTMEVAASLQGQPGSGALAIESPNVDTITVPMGVILGLIPVTNPVETLVFKVLIALKSRNAIVLSCHRKARQVSLRTVKIIREVLAKHEASPDLVQTPDLPPKRELTNLLMSHPDISFILATGGTNMVRSAYRSGTPSIGVGKGNAPVWVCHDAHLQQVAEHIVTSKAFDNGVVCGSENNLIVDHDIEQPFISALVDAGAAVLNAKETLRLLNVAFADGHLDEQWLGKSAQAICQAAGISRSSTIELIVVPQSTQQLDSALFREKLAPIVSMVTVRGEQQALSVTRAVLSNEGRGHTAIIHTHDQRRIEAFAQAADVCRVLVNSPGTQGCIGACNGLALSWTLGCGTAGGSSTSDNVTYRHLQNTKRIAHATPAVTHAEKDVRKLA
ncbi:aldehyde dehydrogenase family protein [Reinekea sp. G2M2-21]|uniref:aldehyde dehydrogenase family protein n=1 Tax=Reinekea sp. G2M2-21 TaxID=2788942 RepID=UPI0018AB3C4B|nr:aldehyde dehydrogenase family protein [Reinekea sp. G2M2-21]